MKGLITVLGSGTSLGVPTIGCRCDVCTSPDWRDNRTRPSVLVQYDAKGRGGAGAHAGVRPGSESRPGRQPEALTSIVIDSTPDFRFQALRAGMCRLDAILYTHPHADHILGLDDVRPFNFYQEGPIPIYGNRRTIDSIRERFSYIFEGNYPFGGVAKLAAWVIEESVDMFGVNFTRVPVLHGYMEVWGYRFGRNAYLTDYQHIPESSYPLLEDLDVLFLDALRRQPHPTHCTLDQALEYARQFRARRTFLTHIAHELGHERTSADLPAGVQMAYDGLQVEIDL